MLEPLLKPKRPFKFRPSHLQSLQRVALLGLSGYAGNWRPAGTASEGSNHVPPDAFRVPELIEELCDYLNDK